MRSTLIWLAGTSLCFLGMMTLLSAAPAETTQKPLKVDGLDNTIDAGMADLSQDGITPFFSYYADYMGNVSGGVARTDDYTHEILFGTEFDFSKIAGLNGGSFTISGAQGTGQNVSASIGNQFYVSESYVVPGFRFYECFWKQKLFDDRLELRLGRITEGDQFAVLPAFVLQASGGINGNPLSLLLNTSFNGSPVATWGGSAKYYFSKDAYIASGLYQAAAHNSDPAYHGLNMGINTSQNGVLNLNQVGWEPNFGATELKSTGKNDSGLPGTYLGGFYYSRNNFPEFNSPSVELNAYGFYAMAQQMVWRNKEDPFVSLSFWGGATYSPQQEIALMPVMGFAGVIYQGAIPGRNQDKVLLNYLAGSLSDAYSASQVATGGHSSTVEHVIEASYVIQINDHYAIQPDIQYVIQPNGESAIPNAVVLGIQVTVNF